MVLPLKQGVSSGDLDGTAVCGVNLILARRNTMMFQRAGMLAPDGRCKTLDASADGYVRAEGCEVVMITSGNVEGTSYSVALGGSAVNQDGRSSSLTAPNGPSQQDVIKSALSHGNVSAADVMSLQMHGTGTSLGDPIEMGGLLGVLGGSEGSRTLVLGALKSSIGHAECAAGAAGLMHAASTLCNKLVIGVMYLQYVNPHVSSAIEAAGVGGSVALPKASHAHALDAMRQQQKAAGASSFAFQGTNAHAVVVSAVTSRGALALHACSRGLFDQRRFWIKSVSSQHLRLDPVFTFRCRSAKVDFCLDDVQNFPDTSIAGERVISFASLVDMTRAWVECVVSDVDAAAAETCMLNNVQTAVTRVGDDARGAGVVRVELLHSHGAPFEVG